MEQEAKTDETLTTRGRNGGKRKGAGRPKGVTDRYPDEAKMQRAMGQLGKAPPKDRWEFTERAFQYAYGCLAVLVDIAMHSDSDSARVSACREIMDRALGKAPATVDITAIKHTDVVYHTAEDVRRMLQERGVPEFLLDYRRPDLDDSDDENGNG